MAMYRNYSSKCKKNSNKQYTILIRQNQKEHPINNAVRSFSNQSHSSQDHQHFRHFNRHPGPSSSNSAGRGNNNNNNFQNLHNSKWVRKDDRHDNSNSSDSFNNGNSERNPNDSAPSKSSANDDQQLRPKSLVEQLKSSMRKNTAPRSNSIDSDTIDSCARNASKKLMNQIKTMDKDNVKELINNPKQPHKKTVLNIQAREKLREGMRKQLKTLGSDDQDVSQFEIEESVNCESIPETLIAQIGRTVDIELGVEDMDLQTDLETAEVVDKDMEVVEKNLGNDFLFGSEMLLMNGFSLLGENEQEAEADISESRFAVPPPLPSEPISKPPEPIPPPEPAVLSSINKPWTIVPPKLPPSQRLNDDFDLNSSRNPEPPTEMETQPIQVIVSAPTVPKLPPPTLKVSAEASVNSANIIDVTKTKPPTQIATIHSVLPPSLPPENPNLVTVKNLPEKSLQQAIFKPTTKSTSAIANESCNQLPEEGEQQKLQTALPNPSATPNINCMTPAPQFDQTPAINNQQSTTLDANTNSSNNNSNNNNEKPGQRANETYGAYRRRMQQERNLGADDDTQSRISENNNNSWMTNSLRNNNNNFNNNNNNNNFNNERKSRFDMNRNRNNDRNRNDKRNFDNRDNNKMRSNSRERGNQWDKRKGEDEMKDAFNYRFNSSASNVDPDRLSSILNPKPMQFKGSFNKRSGFNRDCNRSLSREQTPVNNSVEREFGENLSSVPDVRPCYQTLKKIMEIDGELSRTHERIHGIDKVISNLHSERVVHQQKITKMMHDRKVLFDNLLKRSMQNDSPLNERSASKDRKRQAVIHDDDDDDERTAAKSNKTNASKKLQDLADTKKRKIEDSPSTVQNEEEGKKKKKFVIEEQPKTAQQKQKEKEEEERRRRIEEIRKQKQLRREREEAERKRLEEQARKESNDIIPVIKKEPRDKSVDKSKQTNNKNAQSTSASQQPSEKTDKAKSDKDGDSERFLFKLTDVINSADYKIRSFELNFKKVHLSQIIIDQFKSNNYPKISIDDWNKWTIKVEKLTEVKKEKVFESEESSRSEGAIEIKTVQPKAAETVSEKDPLAIDDLEMQNPPTPGNHLSMIDDDVSMEAPEDDSEDSTDYTEWAGTFTAHTNPIVYLQNIDGKHMVCAAECGKLFKYLLKSGKCVGIFTSHTEICNSFIYCEREGSLYTASSDGKCYRVKYKSFEAVSSKDFNEALQVIEKSKYALYIGAKSGNIFKLKFDLSGESEQLCCIDALILCMKASKEGSRHILIVSSRSNPIQIRDANDGLLLRTLTNELANVSIYDMLIEGSTIYCGSNLHEIFAIDFTTGALKSKRSMSGAGAICVKLHNDHLIAACYDGNIYIFNINSDDDAVNIAGPSKMLLTMDLWDNKIIASTKDTTLKIMNIPT